MMRPFLLIAACLLLSFASAALAATDVGCLRDLPVLDRGRVKPIDSLARETVRSVTGKERFGIVEQAGGGEQSVKHRMDPLTMLLDWQRSPHAWDERPLLYVPNIELRSRVGLPTNAQWISPSDLRADASFAQWTNGLMQRQQQAQQTRELARLTPMEEAAILLRHRLATFDAATAGRLVCVLPHPGDANKGWADLASIAAAPAAVAEGAAITQGWSNVLDRFGSNDARGFDEATAAFKSTLARAHAAAAVDATAVSLEVRYNLWRPFRIVWIGYFVALVLLVASALSTRPLVYRVALGWFIACVVGQVAAFALRCRITGWAPVTNMYETVVWVSLVAAVLSLVLELIARTRTMAVAGAATALIASIVADVMPPEMGGQIGTLAPVLRSNYWLTIHVLTIVSSYAAFALACVLGNIGLYRFAFPRTTTREETARGVRLTYRSVQVGVLLIAAGTILGGLWADVSWGRFWGWDPKEVWALIVLLTYLALLHGRFAGRLGPFGFSAGAVACFTTVLMSWYGVNFVLGAGLHSYGFGSGGQGYVGSYVLAQLAWVVVAWRLHRRQMRSGSASEAIARESVAEPSPSELLIRNPIGARARD